MSPHSIAFLFDLDGTLLDTAPEFTHCMNLLLAEDAQALITVEGLRPLISMGASGMIQHVFGDDFTSQPHTQLIARFLDHYRKNIGSLTYFFDGIPDLLHSLQTAHIPWGIVTNKPTEFTAPLVERFAPLDRAGCVISGDTLSVNKPDPTPLVLAADQLAVAPSQCWYVGDAKTDVQAAHAAGMRVAVAHYGYLPLEENPIAWNADLYIEHPEQLLTLL